MTLRTACPCSAGWFKGQTCNHEPLSASWSTDIGQVLTESQALGQGWKYSLEPDRQPTISGTSRQPIKQLPKPALTKIPLSQTEAAPPHQLGAKFSKVPVQGKTAYGGLLKWQFLVSVPDLQEQNYSKNVLEFVALRRPPPPIIFMNRQLEDTLNFGSLNSTNFRLVTCVCVLRILTSALLATLRLC